MKNLLKKIPVLSPMGKSLARLVRLTGRKLRGKDRHGRDAYEFQRTPLVSGTDFHVRQIENLLNYTKTSGSIYNAQQYLAGYHTINISGLNLEGQRKPKDRFACIPVDFTNKTVLDIGLYNGL